MKRLTLVIFALILLPVASVAKDDEGEKFEVANSSEHATAVKLIALDAKASGKFVVVAPDGEHVPAYYDKKEKKLMVLASVPGGGGTFTLLEGTPSKAKDPKWGKLKTKKEGKVSLGKAVTRVSGEFESDLWEVSVPVDKAVHGRVIIKAKEGDYKLELSPLGSSVGCVETKEIGDAVNESYQAGQQVHDEVFSIFPSIPTDIELLEPNPFQRVIRVETHVWSRKNSGDTLDLFKETGFEITLTWNSPIITIRSWRKQDKTFFNHNGVDLNEIYVEHPIAMQCDDEEAMTERPVTGKVLDIPFKKSFLLKEKSGSTVVHQPDFGTLGIYKECLVLGQDRLMTILSQSWHEGWKAIEIPKGDYEDTMTLICNVGESKKSLKDWVRELE
ncbi:MAG: hypothetical protein K8I27_12375 [Planctomycetes bacterium]|nr:hypothetical protein [Planctomycetota bacterium]